MGRISFGDTKNQPQNHLMRTVDEISVASSQKCLFIIENTAEFSKQQNNSP